MRSSQDCISTKSGERLGTRPRSEKGQVCTREELLQVQTVSVVRTVKEYLNMIQKKKSDAYAWYISLQTKQNPTLILDVYQTAHVLLTRA